jgi:hypothetical protein
MAKYWSDLVGGLVRDWLMITPFSRRVGTGPLRRVTEDASGCRQGRIVLPSEPRAINPKAWTHGSTMKREIMSVEGRLARR